MNGMTENRFALDTNAVIFLTTKGNKIPFGLKEALDEAQLFTSVIVRMESLSKRNISDDEERDIREFLDALTVVPLNDTIEQKAVELRRSTKLKLPDCIVAATAIVLDAVLLTDDDHLLGLSLPGLRTQSI
jgi:predicted nucleic acid-binding protein